MADLFNQDPDTLNVIKKFEGYNPRAYWDHKGYSVGYGSFGAKPGETIDQNEANRRLAEEVGKIDSSLSTNFAGVNMAPNQRRALTSFTYNLGPGWMTGPTRLSAAVRSGDWNSAAQIMQEYNKASGAVNPGLVNRRQQEAAMLLGGPVPAATASAQGGTPMPDPVTGEYTPEEIITARRRQSQMLQAEPPIGGKWGPLAMALQGGAAGYMGNQADTYSRGNQKMLQDALRGAAGAPNIGQYLMSSGVPALQKEGVGAVLGSQQKREDFEYQRKLALELKKQEQQQKLDMFDKFFPGGGGLTGETPSVAPSGGVPSAPGGPLTSTPGVSVTPPIAPTGPIAPSSTTASPGDNLSLPPPSGNSRGPHFDSRRLAAAVAANLISPEAAKLLQPDKDYEKSFDTQSGKDYAEQFKGVRDSAQKARGQMATLDVMEAITKNPATLQGWGSPLSIQMRRIAEAAGIKTEGLAPTQVFEALTGEMSLNLRNPAGGAGMPGSMSDNDLKFLRSMTAGTGNSPEANAFLIGMRKRVLMRDMQAAKLAYNWANNNEGRIDHRFSAALEKWADANPLWSEDEKKALAGEQAKVAQPEAAPAAPAQAAPALSQQEYDAMPVGTKFEHPTKGRLIKTGPNEFRPLSMNEKAGDVADAASGLAGDIGSQISQGPAANFLRWLDQRVRGSGTAQAGTP